MSRRTVSFAVYGTPQPGGSKSAYAIRRGAKRIGGKMVGGTYTGGVATSDANPKAAGWRQRVAQVAGEAMGGHDLLRGPVRLTLAFTVARPKGHFGKRGLRPSAPPYPDVRPDATKLLRSTEDALKGVVFRDDAQSVRLVVSKDYGEPEGVTVTVEELT